MNNSTIINNINDTIMLGSLIKDIEAELAELKILYPYIDDHNTQYYIYLRLQMVRSILREGNDSIAQIHDEIDEQTNPDVVKEVDDILAKYSEFNINQNDDDWYIFADAR